MFIHELLMDFGKIDEILDLLKIGYEGCKLPFGSYLVMSYRFGLCRLSSIRAHLFRVYRRSVLSRYQFTLFVKLLLYSISLNHSTN